MVKLTKMQMKDRRRIEAWLNDETFKENSRDKNPVVPDLSVEDVIETYVPLYISDGAKFYTPLEMGRWLINNFPIVYLPGKKILEPCAGIGNLLYPLIKIMEQRKYEGHPNPQVVAWELDKEASEIGAKLFPQVEWINDTVLDDFERHRGKYDYILMNAPFGTKWGTYDAEKNSVTEATKSEHLFLEFAINALKPGGQMALLGAYNLFDRLPKKLKAWVNERITYVDLGQAPGEFRFTKVKVRGFLVTRLVEAQNEIVYEPEALQSGNADQLEKMRDPVEILDDMKTNGELIQATLTNISQSIADFHDDEPKPSWMVVVPVGVYDALKQLTAGNDELSSIKRTCILLTQNGNGNAGKWVKNHPIEYGQGFWNGFTTEDGDEPILLSV